MALTLKTITFNHDPGSAVTSAMNIRRNKDFEVLVPEYDSAAPRPTTESCAAYSIADAAGQNVFVRVTFTISAPANATYRVRASGGSVLGKLSSIAVTFTGGTTCTVDIPLNHQSFKAVGRHDVSWQWHYKHGGGWHNLVTTSHRIYVLLSIPNAPWTQTFADKRNPWTDLLDECCVKAAGARTATTAAKRMVAAIYGSYSLRYDIVSGAPRYGFAVTGGSFALTNWINYVLRGNAPVNPKFCGGSAEEYRNFLIVNCYDAAASLALMAKVIGAPLDYYFDQPFGYLNYVEPIGRGKCNNPFYGCQGGLPEVGPDDARTRFGNHAYTKLPAAKNFDACMKEWLPALTKILLFLLWLIILIITLGIINAESLLDRANGWLVDLTQAIYDQRTTDISQPFEAAAAGGAPAAQVLQFQV
jgi:hypothetical protein